MELNDRMIDIIEDHAQIVQFLDNLCCAVENPDLCAPRFIPMLNDQLVTDRLTKITEYITRVRKESSCPRQ